MSEDGSVPTTLASYSFLSPFANSTFIGAFDDVAVCEDVSILRHNDAGSQILLLARALLALFAEVAEEKSEHWFLEGWPSKRGLPNRLGGENVNHTRRGLFQDRREAGLHFRVV